MIAQEAPVRPRLSLKLLGGFFATLDGHPLPPFPYDKLRALLVYLALDPAREFSRAELAELLWPEQDGEAARGNLRRALSNLRAVLGDRSAASGYFQINRTALRIRPGAPLDIDIADLATPPIDCAGVSDSAECRACLLRMERSTAAYAGELMAGFSLPDCADFEQWLRIKRENLHRHALQLLDRLIACCMARGEPAGALSFALRYIELEPWNENAVQRAMRLLAEAERARLIQLSAAWEQSAVERILDKLAKAQRALGGDRLKVLPRAVQTYAEAARSFLHLAKGVGERDPSISRQSFLNAWQNA